MPVTDTVLYIFPNLALYENKYMVIKMSSLSIPPEVLLPVGECFNLHFHDDVGVQSLSAVCPGCVSLLVGHRGFHADREGISALETYQF